MEGVDLKNITRWGRVPAWWLLHPDIDADRFSVLAALATYANEHGVCDPSQATLAKRLGRSRPWVNRVIADLVGIGLLEKRARRRSNGGTTSCEYVVQFVPPGAEAPDTGMTGVCPYPDTPRHQADRNQLGSEHIHSARPSAREASSSKQNWDGSEPDPISTPGTGRTESLQTDETMLAKDWQPSPEIRAEAQRLYPDADLTEHTALFVARCRSKRYRIPLTSAGDTWLAWLIEDRRKARERAAIPPKMTAATFPRSKQGDRFDRFLAWGAAAEPAVTRSHFLDA